jgi:hypothetical protein
MSEQDKADAAFFVIGVVVLLTWGVLMILRTY